MKGTHWPFKAIWFCGQVQILSTQIDPPEQDRKQFPEYSHRGSQLSPGKSPPPNDGNGARKGWHWPLKAWKPGSQAQNPWTHREFPVQTTFPARQLSPGPAVKIEDDCLVKASYQECFQFGEFETVEWCLDWHNVRYTLAGRWHKHRCHLIGYL